MTRQQAAGHSQGHAAGHSQGHAAGHSQGHAAGPQVAVSGAGTGGLPAQGAQPGIPAIPPVPGGTAGLSQALVARALLRRVAGRLPIRVAVPGGRLSGAGGPGSPVLVIRDENAFYRRLGSGPAGLAGSYLAGDWDTDDLAGLLTEFAGTMAVLVPASLQALRRWYTPQGPAGQDVTGAGARHHTGQYCDLSDALFDLFRDPTMTDAGGLFAPGDAQRRKIGKLLDRTGTGPGSTVLEIGAGWGDLSIRAAARGARVTALTNSPCQYAAARRRAAAAGVADRVDVQLAGCHQVTGCYDVILSVEMIGAAGERSWPACFTAMDRLLAPGGRAGLQAITMPPQRMPATHGIPSWLHRCLPPGGQIPSLEAVTGTLRTDTSLAVSADFPMGQHYARTLQEWRRRFLAATGAVTQPGFGSAFQRLWNLYLACSEAGFRAGCLDVHQLLLERGW
jgi:cyclopropane-fatty-acyl-phospholipid synthase